MRDVVIVSAVRTPVGKFQGALSEMSAVQLGAVVVREAARRAGIDAASVDECLMGCVLPAGLGQNPARQAALQGGLADTVAAMTINMVCGWGLKAVALAAQSVDDGCGGDCCGGWDGVDDERAVSSAAGTEGISDGRFGGGGFDGEGWFVVRVRRPAHGNDGGASGGEAFDHARDAGCLCAGVAPESRGCVERRTVRCGGGSGFGAGKERVR